VADAFLAAYPDYVRSRLARLGVEGSVIEAAITRGHKAMGEAFTEWVGQEPTLRRASPLELFREALALPTEVAVAAGAKPVLRDAFQMQALPADVLDLAPATSRDLGEEAWAAHVAWGLARADEIAGAAPQAATRRVAGVHIALVASNLMDRTRIAEAAAAAGCELVMWRNPGAIASGLTQAPPAVAFVDLTHPAAAEAIGRLVAAGVRTVAYGPHVDDVAMAAAGALGADEVLPRSRFFARLPSLFPQAV